MNYPVLYLEAAAIHYGLCKFYQYLYGVKFTLRTDQKPLISLFSERKGIPQMYASRLQRWAAYLSTFDYEIQYIKGKNNIVADYLSRAPIKTNTISDEFSGKTKLLYYTSLSEEWPLNNDEIKKRTAEDTDLKKVLNYLKSGKWPHKVPKNLQPYFNKRLELSVEDDVILWGHRIVIPTGLQHQILNKLHSHHFGIVKTKSLARSIVYWPELNNEIENKCKSCIHCLETRQNPPKSELNPWKIEEKPWTRIHADFLGPINNKMFLLIIDSYSKWPEVYQMRGMSSEETEEKFKMAFATWGFPKTVVTDNGRSFTAENLQVFFRRNGIKHVTIAPYNPMSNGFAENGVKTFKNNIKARLSDPSNKGKNLNMLTSEFLFSYRNIEHSSTKETPAKLMLGREVRTRLQILKEKKTNTEEDRETLKNHIDAQEKQKHYYGGKKRTFEINENVMVADYTTPNHRKWTNATIIKKIGKNTYFCRLRDKKIWKRHTNQIIRAGTAGASGSGRGEQNNKVKLTKTFYPASDQCQPGALSAKQTISNFQIPPEAAAPVSSPGTITNHDLTDSNSANTNPNTLLQHTNIVPPQPNNNHSLTTAPVLKNDNIFIEETVSVPNKINVDSVVEKQTSRSRKEYDDIDKVERGSDRSLGNDAGNVQEQLCKKITGTKARSRNVKPPARFRDYLMEIE